MRDATNSKIARGWPPGPPGGVFPEVLGTLLVAQLLLYDRCGMTPEQGQRNVRKLVMDAGLPTLGRIGSALLYSKKAVIEWLAGRSGGVDGYENGDKLDGA
ncbi:MAG: hypothetical protein JSU86_03960 [Phycisphaerales bacterium]|nr:MAG: hypothetical protein JSU86_03960 [Phycisphaerales bacterium]